MKILNILLITLFFTLSLIAQDSAKITEWRGLVLDQASPEKATEVLGKPKTDKQTDLRLLSPNWVSKETRKKKWRVFHYENIEGFKDVKLAFDDKSKLVVIQLEPKKITAQAFVGSYSDQEFRFANEVMSPADFKSPRQDDKPKSLGVVYVLVSLNDEAFVFGGVGNATGSVMSTMFGGSMIRNTSRSLAGDVYMIQLISRTLENKDGVNLLK